MANNVMQDAVEPFTAEVRANFDRFIRIQIEPFTAILEELVMESAATNQAEWVKVKMRK